MDEDVRSDEDWLRVILLHFKESISHGDGISLISFSHLLPRWKISLIELPQSDRTIIVEMRLWNGRHSIKWHLKLWAFQIDCEVDKRPWDRCSASTWVILTFTYFHFDHLQNCVCSFTKAKGTYLPKLNDAWSKNVAAEFIFNYF